MTGYAGRVTADVLAEGYTVDLGWCSVEIGIRRYAAGDDLGPWILFVESEAIGLVALSEQQARNIVSAFERALGRLREEDMDG